MSVPSFADSGPALIGFLFIVVTLRAQATYWLGRTVPAAANRKRNQGAVARWFLGPTPRKGAAILERWGLIVIPLCFLTVGLQTAVIAGAGLVQMSWRRFTLAMIPGAVLWALLYGLGLLAVWAAAVSALAGNAWSYVALAAVVVLFVVVRQLKKKRVHAAKNPGRRASAEGIS